MRPMRSSTGLTLAGLHLTALAVLTALTACGGRPAAPAVDPSNTDAAAEPFGEAKPATLAEHDARKAELVKLRYFAGLTQIASLAVAELGAAGFIRRRSFEFPKTQSAA